MPNRLRRSVRVMVNFTPAEAKAVKAQAKAAQVPLAKFVRMALIKEVK